MRFKTNLESRSELQAAGRRLATARSYPRLQRLRAAAEAPAAESVASTVLLLQDVQPADDGQIRKRRRVTDHQHSGGQLPGLQGHTAAGCRARPVRRRRRNDPAWPSGQLGRARATLSRNIGRPVSICMWRSRSPGPRGSRASASSSNSSVMLDVPTMDSMTDNVKMLRRCFVIEPHGPADSRRRDREHDSFESIRVRLTLDRWGRLRL